MSMQTEGQKPLSPFERVALELTKDTAAYAAARSLGAVLHEACKRIAHKGGDLPFDSVMAEVYAEVLRREGWVDAEPGQFTEASFPVAVTWP
ncbi:hypothetical protein [Microbacterium sp. YY-01]|uniref:hypothetical protein n=1 Tax=Microbacterium sp. YY-01 TaxID=3421634 RepID=UPI003D176EDC